MIKLNNNKKGAAKIDSDIRNRIINVLNNFIEICDSKSINSDRHRQMIDNILKIEDVRPWRSLSKESASTLSRGKKEAEKAFDRFISLVAEEGIYSQSLKALEKNHKR